VSNLDPIQKLIEEATEEPWTVKESTYRYGDEFHTYISGVENADYVIAGLDDGIDEDAALIAHARQLLPLLYEVAKVADDLRCNCFAASPLLMSVDEAFEALDSYVSEHLSPEGSK
jgi:hypothetical protein